MKIKLSEHCLYYVTRLVMEQDKKPNNHLRWLYYIDGPCWEGLNIGDRLIGRKACNEYMIERGDIWNRLVSEGPDLDLTPKEKVNLCHLSYKNYQILHDWVKKIYKVITIHK